jgi:hypothetical protein
MSLNAYGERTAARSLAPQRCAKVATLVEK